MMASLILFAAGCTPGADQAMETSADDSAEILNKTWQWEATVTPVEKIAVAHPERYTIHFAEDGKLQAQFDCNSGGGSYTLSGRNISFGPMLSTRMACPEDSQDLVFMRDLQRVNSFFLQEDKLYLELPYDSGTLRFGVVKD